jgi:hypothetical protein
MLDFGRGRRRSPGKKVGGMAFPLENITGGKGAYDTIFQTNLVHKSLIVHTYNILELTGKVPTLT